MSDTSSNKKRLAKNTLSISVQLLFLMLISFYTSRVVLQALGAEDFGTYNVVGGVVVMFTVINSAMTSGTQRHLSYELGKADGDVGLIFSACLNIHLWLALIITILAETIGLWFVNTQLNFPEGRMTAVNWVYQLSILACIANIVRVPFNASIIAYEKMSFYAYIGVVEGLLKLGIVFLLAYALYDKLIFYSTLMLIVITLITIVYYFYCHRHFSEIRYKRVHNSSLYKSLLSFSGWTLFGSVANMGRNQGMAMIINIFYGVTLNAAIGISNQVNAGITQFVTGFQQAFNPQLTKAQAANDKAYQTSLINKTAKYSYLVILFCALPILFNLDYILSIWLGKFPPYTQEICLWIVIASLIDSISGPLWVTIFATGKIKSYQVIISTVFLLNLPLAYLCGKLNWQPQYAFVFQAIINFIAIVVRLMIMKKQINFGLWKFTKEVFVPISIVTLAMFPFLYFIYYKFSFATSIIPFCAQSAALLIYETFIIVFIGLRTSERKAILSFAKSRIRNKK